MSRSHLKIFVLLTVYIGCSFCFDIALCESLESQNDLGYSQQELQEQERQSKICKITIIFFIFSFISNLGH